MENMKIILQKLSNIFDICLERMIQIVEIIKIKRINAENGQI